TTKTSNVVTVSTAGLIVGEPVTGTGIPAGTTIASIGAGTITLTNAATATGTVSLTFTRSFSVSSMGGAGPTSVVNPSVGGQYFPPAKLGLDPATVTPAQLAAAQLQGNTDVSGRPLFPSLYLTDITNFTPAQLASTPGHAGDWQYGGVPVSPSAVFGTWKSF